MFAGRTQTGHSSKFVNTIDESQQDPIREDDRPQRSDGWWLSITNSNQALHFNRYIEEVQFTQSFMRGTAVKVGIIDYGFSSNFFGNDFYSRPWQYDAVSGDGLAGGPRDLTDTQKWHGHAVFGTCCGRYGIFEGRTSAPYFCRADGTPIKVAACINTLVECKSTSLSTPGAETVAKHVRGVKN